MNTTATDSNSDLARSVYETALRETESFRENNIGAGLAYLLGAILTDCPNAMRVECERDAGHDAFIALLTNAFPPNHAIWTFVRGDKLFPSTSWIARVVRSQYVASPSREF